ncbi:IclR family transcriptional regulator [Lentibacillus lipolyticus]|nr:IclR family transcriptional regulator [Lentibacillus lipolyticus]
MGLEYQIKSVVRAFRIIEVLARESLTAVELTMKLDINKSTLHRFLVTLKDLGYIEIDDNNAWRLSQSFVNLGLHTQKHYQIQTIARPYMERLMQEFKESAFLAVFNGDEVHYVDSVESSHAVRTVFGPGKKSPAYAVASGKMFLASMKREQLESYLASHELKPLTENTHTEIAALKRDLQRIRESGISIDNEELEIGLRGFACPIRDELGDMNAALCIAGIASRIQEKSKVDRLMKRLKEDANKISWQLGYKEGLKNEEELV